VTFLLYFLFVFFFCIVSALSLPVSWSSWGGT